MKRNGEQKTGFAHYKIRTRISFYLTFRFDLANTAHRYFYFCLLMDGCFNSIKFTASACAHDRQINKRKKTIPNLRRKKNEKGERKK